ncbi:hypothetical protein BOX15_Mlig005569g2, partial [Macrostomum lignano]
INMASRNFNREIRKKLLDFIHVEGDSEAHEFNSRPMDAERQFGSILDEDEDVEPTVYISEQEDDAGSVDEFMDDNIIDDEPEPDFAHQLLLFYLLFNIPVRAMNYLLRLLVSNGCQVPATLHLLKKPLSKFKTQVETMGTGQFAYVGIFENIKYCVDRMMLPSSLFDSTEIKLNLKLNCDGLPLFKSSKITLWPILVQFEHIRQPFPVASFCGLGLPPLLDYLEQLTNELSILQTTGIQYKDHKFKVEKISFICDTPARSFIQGTKGHAGYSSCCWCRTTGEYIHGRVVFPSFCELRTNEDYATMNENNQTIRSPLLLVVPFTTAFPPDFMHMVCLGIMKKLMKLYTSGVKGLRAACRLSLEQVKRINSEISYLRCYVPREFSRKPRLLHDLKHYKASEFRNYLLYWGPVLLQKELQAPYYEHFLLLHFATYVYSSPKLRHLFPAARACIQRFLFDIRRLFHESLYTVNFHGLFHLPDFVEMHGSLLEMSAFPFENFLGLLKRRIRASRHIFSQSVNQLRNVRAIYADAELNTIYFSPESPNNCAILPDGRIVVVSNVTASGHVDGTVLELTRHLYQFDNSRFSSSLLGIGYYRRTRVRVMNRFLQTRQSAFLDNKSF